MDKGDEMKILPAVFVLIFILIFVGFIATHEKVHQIIFADYGINSRVLINGTDMLTHPDKPCPTDTCNLAHEINESIGYQVLPMLILVGVGLFIIILMLEQIKDLTEEKDENKFFRTV